MHIYKHFITITKHRHKVIAHCIRAGIPLRGFLHDLSKYSPTEFLRGAKYYKGIKSPNVGEREEKGYSAAWLHHKGRNRHHFEYWTDYCTSKRKVVPIKMPIVFVKEMFCDRVAASKIYQGKNYTNSSPLEYFLGGKQNRFINPETSALLEKWLVILAEQGEAAVFDKIRNTSEY